MSKPREVADRVADRKPRSGRLLRATIQSGGNAAQDAIIRNLSRNGVGGIAASSSLQVGEHAEIMIGGSHTYSGVIRWTNGNTFGFEFDCEIDPANVDAAIRRAIDACCEEGWKVEARHIVEPPKPSGLPRRRV